MTIRYDERVKHVWDFHANFPGYSVTDEVFNQLLLQCFGDICVVQQKAAAAAQQQQQSYHSSYYNL